MKTSSYKILKLNGKDAYISKEESTSHLKSEPIKYKKHVVKVLNYFLKDAEFLYRHEEGYTVSKTLTTLKGGFDLGITRMANPMGDIRKKLPKNISMFTFRYSSSESWKYGIEITDASIKFMRNLKASIEAEINNQ
ncbi:MAG: Unknown protein [uncultured Sulfurovum sp.]|uniref:Uncharacterized protein n=1 Tax=uncultured Sulfurovum sp. TaxID=269237 RepID=A0A6S6T5J9_9BACT|nr:MAG: Unknown protein [uncultured Sulfurovum sp.]